jgi:hypothetical protein
VHLTFTEKARGSDPLGCANDGDIIYAPDDRTSALAAAPAKSAECDTVPTTVNPVKEAASPFQKKAHAGVLVDADTLPPDAIRRRRSE